MSQDSHTLRIDELPSQGHTINGLESLMLAGFPSGTLMLFSHGPVPPGWTKRPVSCLYPDGTIQVSVPFEGTKTIKLPPTAFVAEKD